MRKIVDYQVVIGEEFGPGEYGRNDLVDQVTNLIKAGWEPQGGAFVDHLERDGDAYRTYGPATVKHDVSGGSNA